ncbi:tyrosine-type recombinase/integrase [Pseudomonas fakonensis]|uniref:Tyrosine-type recombinase/integrase n=1 Tax=Pseudomonas fakonensis TaxID=2842355 RepID=A0ABX8NBY2_9PSED|nr:gamma-mobile-trio recombinase GmtY [Pseudomonas fakonensis]QXH53325.1 tyrosine-type recombinase/integrase [Pseudomonas fakonensis]
MQIMKMPLLTAIKIKVEYQGPTQLKKIRLPALVTREGVLISLLQYLSEAHRSNSWRAKVTSAVGMLLDYIALSGIPFDNPTTLLRSFRTALKSGTIDLSLEDPTGLYWPNRSQANADDIVTLLTGYTDWLTKQPGHSGVVMNPIREATKHEERLNWCAYHHRQDNKLLSHLTSDEEREMNRFRREVGRERASPVILDEVKRFPQEHFNTLIDEGFVIASPRSEDKRLRMDYKSQAMTLLMNHGGLRKSELFHIYLDDIEIDVERCEAIVRVHHPSQGKAPEKGYKNREDYLLRKFRMKPRTDYLKSESLHAGWKAPTTNTQMFFVVSFYPPVKAQEFLLAFQNYLLYQRVDSKGRHPFAFTNSKGRPETIKNFQRLHTAAVIRIGLGCSKYQGTSEHGHRHAYGYRLADNGFTQLEIQRSMHHAHPDSCLVYLQATDEDLRERMRKTEAKNRTSAPVETFESEDIEALGRPLASYRGITRPRN